MLSSSTGAPGVEEGHAFGVLPQEWQWEKPTVAQGSCLLVNARSTGLALRQPAEARLHFEYGLRVLCHWLSSVALQGAGDSGHMLS